MSRHLLAALATVEHLGYTYHGGAQWKPPLGKSAEPLLDRITELKAENERLKNVAQFKEDVATTLRTQLEAAKQPLHPITADEITPEIVAAYGANFNTWDTPSYAEQIEAAYNSVIKHKGDTK